MKSSLRVMCSYTYTTIMFNCHSLGFCIYTSSISCVIVTRKESNFLSSIFLLSLSLFFCTSPFLPDLLSPFLYLSFPFCYSLSLSVPLSSSLILSIPFDPSLFLSDPLHSFLIFSIPFCTSPSLLVPYTSLFPWDLIALSQHS